jgi:AGZA family xanthine/uracil permease-like MFS transporter
MVKPEFYQRNNWVQEFFEGIFKIERRGSTIKAEIYFGLIHFISCLYCLAVVPKQLAKAGYDPRTSFVATATCSGIGSIAGGLFANLPFAFAPPTVVVIFLAVFLRNFDDVDPTSLGSAGVVLSGCATMLLFYRPLGNFVARLIPTSIQTGTAIGIGLLTALAGATEIDFVRQGERNLVQLGNISPDVCIAMSGVVLICIATYYKVKGSFCMAIIACSLVSWINDGNWPKGVFSFYTSTYYTGQDMTNKHLPVLTLDLIFLYVLYLNGLVSTLSMMAGLTREDGAIPRGRWIFVLTGLMTVAGGFLTGAPVLISPESAAGIKDGARTGLSAVTCGVLFIASLFFAPVFEAIPNAGTSPCLLMIGTMLFQNVARIDWKSVKDATPAFVVLFFIPFSFSIIQGVILGYIVYVVVGIFTGDLYADFVFMMSIYFPALHRYLPYSSLPQDDSGSCGGDDPKKDTKHTPCPPTGSGSEDGSLHSSPRGSSPRRRSLSMRKSGKSGDFGSHDGNAYEEVMRAYREGVDPFESRVLGFADDGERNFHPPQLHILRSVDSHVSEETQRQMLQPSPFHAHVSFDSTDQFTSASTPHMSSPRNRVPGFFS